MKARTDIEVAVLSARSDLDLAISTWLPGYVAQRTDDLDTVMEITRRGGIVLVDLGSPRHDEWAAALRDRGFDGPTVFLDPNGDMTIDLRERVVVSCPLSLSALLAGFEEAQRIGAGRRRRRGEDRDRRSTGGGAQRSADDAARSAPSASAGRRRRRTDRHRDRSSRVTSLWAALRGRSARRSARHGGVAGLDGEVAARADGAGERAFQDAFRDASTEPTVQRRIATPEGRVRVQTDEELFAAHPANARPPIARAPVASAPVARRPGGQPGPMSVPVAEPAFGGGGERGDLAVASR